MDYYDLSQNNKSLLLSNIVIFASLNLVVSAVINIKLYLNFKDWYDSSNNWLFRTKYINALLMFASGIFNCLRLNFPKDTYFYNLYNCLNLCIYALSILFLLSHFSLRYISFIINKSSEHKLVIAFSTSLFLIAIIIAYFRLYLNDLVMSNYAEAIGVIIDLIWEFNNLFKFYRILSVSKSKNTEIDKSIKVSFITSILLTLMTIMTVLSYLLTNETNCVCLIIAPVGAFLTSMSPYSIYIIKKSKTILKQTGTNDIKSESIESCDSFRVVRSPTMSDKFKFRSPIF